MLGLSTRLQAYCKSPPAQALVDDAPVPVDDALPKRSKEIYHLYPLLGSIDVDLQNSLPVPPPDVGMLYNLL